MANGDLIKVGTFYLDGVIQPRPTRPWNNGIPSGATQVGNIPVYRVGHQIEIRDTDTNDANQIQWREVNVGHKKLLVADRVLLTNVSWEDLDQQLLITGKVVTIDKQKYNLRVLAGGEDYRSFRDSYSGGSEGNEWDQLITNEGGFSGLPSPSPSNLNELQEAEDLTSVHNQTWNWFHMHAWVQDAYRGRFSHRAIRGFYSPRHWDCISAKERLSSIGWRPVLEILNNEPPKRPIIVNPMENVRTGNRPILEAIINHDREGDRQHFRLQLADNQGFTSGLQVFLSNQDQTGWEAFDGTTWVSFPASGVSHAAYKKVRYTPQNHLISGQKYFFRFGAVDTYSGSQDGWSGEQELINLLGASGDCEVASDFGVSQGHHTIAEDNSTFVQGGRSINMNNPSNHAAFRGKFVKVKVQGYYLVCGWAKSNGTVPVGLSALNMGSKEQHLSEQITSAEWQFVSLTLQASETDYAFGMVVSDKGIANFDGIRVYEISKAEYDLIQRKDPLWSGMNLALQYPHTGSTVLPIQKPRSVRIGDILVASLKKPLKTSDYAKRTVVNVAYELPTRERRISRVETDDPSVIFTGTFSRFPNAGASGGSYQYTSSPASAMRLTFTGTGIRLYGLVGPVYGTAHVYIDTILCDVASFYSASTQSQEKVFEHLTLPYGEHVISLVHFSGTTVTDYFEVITDDRPATIKVEACNNALDTSPTYEEITASVRNGTHHQFLNREKTASDWAVGVRMTVKAHGTYGPVEIDGFGISYE